MYLPYLDIGKFAWKGGATVDTPVTWHHNMPRDLQHEFTHYPGTWGNDYMGGPLSSSRCRCCNCDELIDEEEAVYPTDGEPWCHDCCDNRYSWCEQSGSYCEHDEMIEVRCCHYYDRVSRRVGSFRSRREYSGPHIMYVRAELADGTECYVPESEEENGRWIPDMQENGWVRMPFLHLSYYEAWSPCVSSMNHDRWSWEDPDCSNVSEVTINDDETMLMMITMGVPRMLDAEVHRLGLHWVSLRGKELGIADDKGGLYRAVPRLRESARSYVAGGTLDRADIDLNNREHLMGLDSSAIEGWDIVYVNTNTADTAETASNL
jgi:hypothetical protein